MIERVDHPDTGDFLPGEVEGGLPSQLQGVEKHPVEVPGCQSQRDIEREFRLVPLIPWTAFLFNEILQLFHEFGRAEHRQHLLSG